MKRIFIVISILVLSLAAAAALGMDHSRTALAQNPLPPNPDERGTGGGGEAVPQWFNNQPEGASTDGGVIQDYPYREMSYQGRLEIDGSPANGPIDLTFRLYSIDIGGTSIWTETQTVNCENGLFSVMLGAVEPLPYAQKFNQQLYLGIQPEGAAAELTPRQMLGTVGYAMNLHGGATVVDTNPAGGYSYSLWVSSSEHRGIYGSSAITDGVGIYGFASGPWGSGSADPTGVRGEANNGIGVHGTADYIGVMGEGYLGVYGEANDMYSYGVYGYGSSYTGTVGVYGYSGGNYSYGVLGSAYGIDSPGVYGSTSGDDASCPPGDTYCLGGVMSFAWGNSYASTSYADADARCAYLGQTDNNGFFTAYFNNFGGTGAGGLGVNGYADISGDLTVDGLIYGTLAPMAINAGSEPLERGDVVVVVGMDAPMAGGNPVMRVQKATPETASAIVGVVNVWYEACDRPAEELQTGEACGGFHHDVTTIQPGQYLGVVTLGTFEWLKVDASTPIKAGDLLSISATAGVAAKAQQITIEGVSFYAPGTIIGKALQDLDAGTGYIAVFVSLK